MRHDDAEETKTAVNRRQRPVFFRKADAGLLVVLAAAAVSLLAMSAVRGYAGMQQPRLKIFVGNKVYGVYDLREDQTIRIGNGNVCEISGGAVRMTEADCPDQVCVHTRAISEDGGSIVCLPNQVVLRVTGADPDQREVDAIAE